MYKKIAASLLALTLASAAVAAPAADFVSLGTSISASADVTDGNANTTSGLVYSNVYTEDGVEYVDLVSYEGQSDNVIIPEKIYVASKNKSYPVHKIRSNFTISYKESIKTLNIKANINSIPASVFSGCTNLTKVVLPDTIETIGEKAFSNCTNLYYINVPKKLKTIGTSAFNGAFSGKAVAITLGGYINSIGNSAFANCKSLIKVNISTQFLLGIGSSCFQNCTALESLTLPSKFSFAGYDDDISLPANICNNTNLKSIDIPARFKSIGSYAFANNANLTKVGLHNGLEKIGKETFNNCKNLKSIVLPGTIKSIGEKAFGYFDGTPIYGFYFKGCPHEGKAPAVYHMANQNLKFVGAHAINWTTTKAATCVSSGYQTGKCICCGGSATRTIPATGRHTYVTSKNSRGDIITKCTQCGTSKVVTNIAAGGKTVGLKTAYKYTGKTIKPKFTVKYGNTTLKNGRDYTVKIVNNKKVGKAKVVITGKGAYRGTIVKYFRINPTKQSIGGIKGAKKAIVVRYRKISANSATGYQIQVASNKSFSGAKTVKAARATYRKTVSGLKSGKKYYVRVRTYKKVGSKTYVGAWSTVKAVRTK